MIFLMYIATMRPLDYSGEESKKHQQFAVYDSDAHVTLEKGQGHQTSL